MKGSLSFFFYITRSENGFKKKKKIISFPFFLFAGITTTTATIKAFLPRFKESEKIEGDDFFHLTEGNSQSRNIIISA